MIADVAKAMLAKAMPIIAVAGLSGFFAWLGLTGMSIATLVLLFLILV